MINLFFPLSCHVRFGHVEHPAAAFAEDGLVRHDLVAEVQRYLLIAAAAALVFDRGQGVFAQMLHHALIRLADFGGQGGFGLF